MTAFVASTDKKIFCKSTVLPLLLEVAGSPRQAYSALPQFSHPRGPHTQADLVDMPPVLAVVIEPLPDHAHDLREGHNIVGKVSNL